MNIGASVKADVTVDGGWKGEWGIGYKVALGKVHLLPSLTLNAQQIRDVRYVVLDPIRQSIVRGETNLARYSVGFNLGVLLF